jgi:hypothetical protein
MNDFYFASRHSGYTRTARETCSKGIASSEEKSQQLSCSPHTSDTSEEMNPPMPLRSSSTANTLRTERLKNKMVLVERVPEPLPSNQSIHLRPSLQRPMSLAPVLWTPVLIPVSRHPINTRSGQVSVVRDLDHYIIVSAGNYERMRNAVLQQALQVIQAPTNLRTKSKALPYLKSYFFAVRDRSHVIYVEKYKLVSR